MENIKRGSCNFHISSIGILLLIFLSSGIVHCQIEKYQTYFKTADNLYKKGLKIHRDLLDYSKSLIENSIENTNLDLFINASDMFESAVKHYTNYLFISTKTRENKDESLDYFIYSGIKTIVADLNYYIEKINLGLSFTKNSAVSNAGQALKEEIREFLDLCDTTKL